MSATATSTAPRTQDPLARQVAGTAAFLEEQPAFASTRPVVEGSLTGSYEVALEVGHHRLQVDEPRRVGGRDTGPTPVEVALAALASCQAITYRIAAAQLGVTLTSIRVRAEGDYDARCLYGVDGGPRPGFRAVRVEVSLRGPDAERHEELRELVDGRCPVLDMLTQPTPVTTRLVPPSDRGSTGT